jgi:hypothetical protein
MENQNAQLLPELIIDIVYCFSMCISVIFMLKTSLTDPGIIPR